MLGAFMDINGFPPMENAWKTERKFSLCMANGVRVMKCQWRYKTLKLNIYFVSSRL